MLCILYFCTRAAFVAINFIMMHKLAYYTADSAGRSSFIILRPDDVGADAGVSEFQQQSS